MNALQLYSQRQLSPFQGLVYVVSIPLARAVSNDGVFWQIQVSCEYQQHQMGLQQAGLARRYVLWGVWSAQSGIKAMPLDPMLDVPEDSVIEQELLPAVQSSLSQLPFPPRDHYELWILDSLENLPVALIATRLDAYNLEQRKSTHWRASTLTKRDFKPACFNTTTDALLKLEQLIADNTCCPIRSQWFLRDESANGTGICAQNLEQELAGRSLDKSRFPELLIREDWPNNDARLLAMDYHNWLSPRLLTMHGMSTAIRERLELAAQQYAVETSQLLHLYPEVINPKIINRIQVEARLRLAAENG